MARKRWSEFSDLKTTEKYLKNQKIFSQGDIADAVYFILKGRVKITVLSEHGKEAVVGIFRSKNHRKISQEPEDIQPGRYRRRRLLHPQGPGEDHRAFRTWQGSGGRNFPI